MTTPLFSDGAIPVVTSTAMNVLAIEWKETA